MLKRSHNIYKWWFQTHACKKKELTKWTSSSGNNVLRTIHGVGEMMTQMVMSRGVPNSSPDTPPSLRYGKGHLTADNEDVMVMDTKLKIIEILQVRTTTEYLVLPREFGSWWCTFCVPVSSSCLWGWTTGSHTCCPSTRKSLGKRQILKTLNLWLKCLQLHVSLFFLIGQIQKKYLIAITCFYVEAFHIVLTFISLFVASEPDIDEIAAKAESMFAGRYRSRCAWKLMSCFPFLKRAHTAETTCTSVLSALN